MPDFLSFPEFFRSRPFFSVTEAVEFYAITGGLEKHAKFIDPDMTPKEFMIFGLSNGIFNWPDIGGPEDETLQLVFGMLAHSRWSSGRMGKRRRRAAHIDGVDVRRAISELHRRGVVERHVPVPISGLAYPGAAEGMWRPRGLYPFFFHNIVQRYMEGDEPEPDRFVDSICRDETCHWAQHVGYAFEDVVQQWLAWSLPDAAVVGQWWGRNWKWGADNSVEFDCVCSGAYKEPLFVEVKWRNGMFNTKTFLHFMEKVDELAALRGNVRFLCVSKLCFTTGLARFAEKMNAKAGKEIIRLIDVEQMRLPFVPEPSDSPCPGM